MSLFFLLFQSCQTPEDLTPSVSKHGINNFIASFPDISSDDNIFDAEIDYENKIINVVIPYNYPTNSNNVITEDDITSMKVRANLDDNVMIEPKLLYMDLSKENYITVITQSKEKTTYKVIAEIRKSNQCLITKFNLPDLNLQGVINESNKTISIVTADLVGQASVDLTISHGATISPDPRIDLQNYDNDVVLTVTAQNGIDQSVYTVKKSIPEKIANGLRPGSKTILWAKKLVDIGIITPNITTGIAVTENYIFLNARGENSIYIDRKTGEYVGSYDLGSVKGLNKNYYSTADNNDNVLICNRTPEDGASFKIWKFSDVNTAPEIFIDWTTSLPMGRKFSVKGDITKNAIITVPINQLGAQFARWQVVNGNLVSQTPVIITASGINWTTNIDIVYSDESNLTSDYFASFFGQSGSVKKFTWFDGTTNTPKLQGPDISGNWIPNSVDHVEFNNIQYVLHNTVNAFTWGSDDNIFMYDLSANILSNPEKVVETGLYGGKALGVQNTGGTGDVAFRVSDNGYYLYVYLMFTNGYVVCVQYDCIDM